jgi:hypothetical protein
VPDRPPQPVDRLQDHIDELESLIRSGNAPAQDPRSIPVLDDVVDAEDIPAPEAAPAGDPDPEERVMRRLEAELTDLVQVFLDVAKRCIREELGKPPEPPDPRTRD